MGGLWGAWTGGGVGRGGRCPQLRASAGGASRRGRVGLHGCWPRRCVTIPSVGSFLALPNCCCCCGPALLDTAYHLTFRPCRVVLPANAPRLSKEHTPWMYNCPGCRQAVRPRRCIGPPAGRLSDRGTPASPLVGVNLWPPCRLPPAGSPTPPSTEVVHSVDASTPDHQRPHMPWTWPSPAATGGGRGMTGGAGAPTGASASRTIGGDDRGAFLLSAHRLRWGVAGARGLVQGRLLNHLAR